jgi:hypothetical protein
VNCLRERALAPTSPTWLAIFDDDLIGRIATLNAKEPPPEGDGSEHGGCADQTLQAVELDAGGARSRPLGRPPRPVFH